VRYAPLAVERLGAAVCVLPAYAAKPTRRERVSRRGPSGAGERAARALTQERAHRTLRRLQAGRTAAASRRPGERLPSCVHPRRLHGHGKPSTASRSAAHSPASKRPLDLPWERSDARGVGGHAAPALPASPRLRRVRHACTSPVPRHAQGLRPVVRQHRGPPDTPSCPRERSNRGSRPAGARRADGS
jgi:hypothetical protein